MSRNFVVLGRARGGSPFPPAAYIPSPSETVDSNPNSRPSADSYQAFGNDLNEGATPSKEPGEYVGLIRNLFDGPAVVAILGGYSALSEGIAAELSEPHKGTGRRVVITDIRRVLQITPLMLPDASDFVPGKHPNVWLWPAPSGQKLEFFRSREVTPIVTAGPGNWLDSLRRSFDAVLLDCPALEGSPSVAEVAAMADGAVLAVEAGLTLKQQIQRDQECLRLRGVKVAGCILIQRS